MRAFGVSGATALYNQITQGMWSKRMVTIPQLSTAIDAPRWARHDLHKVVSGASSLHLSDEVLDVLEAVHEGHSQHPLPINLNAA